jgi:hypothetical protein
MPRENFYPFGHDEPLTDELSEFGIPHSRDAPSTRVAGGHAAKCAPRHPSDKGTRRRGSVGSCSAK